MQRFFRQTSPLVILATIATSLYLYITQKSELAIISGFTLHITDILFALILIYCFAGVKNRWNYSVPDVALLILCGLFVFNFLRGIGEFSPSQAGVPFRSVSNFAALAV